jgi:hypothetical protein
MYGVCTICVLCLIAWFEGFELVCKILFWQLAQLAVGIAVTVTVTMTERQLTATTDNMWGEVSSFQFPFAHNIPYPIIPGDIHFKISLFLFLVFDFDFDSIL